MKTNELNVKEAGMRKPSFYAVIPADVRYDKRLKPNAKLLYGEITALCNKEGYCWAKNEYFAKLYDVNIDAISKWLSQLKKYEYIKIAILNYYQRKISIIPLIQKDKGGNQKRLGGLIQKDKAIYNNTDNNKSNISSISDPLNSKTENIHVQEIFQEYISKILPGSRLTNKAKSKIKSRLNEFSIKEIFKGIDNFSKDSWWMDNNAFRGISWFFYSEDRIEQFKNLIPRKKVEEEKEELRTTKY